MPGKPKPHEGKTRQTQPEIERALATIQVGDIVNVKNIAHYPDLPQCDCEVLETYNREGVCYAKILFLINTKGEQGLVLPYKDLSKIRKAV